MGLPQAPEDADRARCKKGAPGRERWGRPASLLRLADGEMLWELEKSGAQDLRPGPVRDLDAGRGRLSAELSGKVPAGKPLRRKEGNSSAPAG